MQKKNFVFALLATVLFICFLSFLETKKANASLGLVASEDSWIMDQWIIAEAYELESRQDVTDQYSSEVWQFLNNKGFVQFRDRLINHTGEWTFKNGEITIQKDGDEAKATYAVEKVGRNEIILSDKELKIRMLKLNNI